MADEGDADAQVKQQSSVMDMEGSWTREPSSRDLGAPHDHDNDFEMRLRKDPTRINMDTATLKGESSVMDVEMRRKHSTSAGLQMQTAAESGMKTLRGEQTIIMAEENANTLKGRSALNLEMSIASSARMETFMSLGNETSVMDTTSSQAYGTDAEMNSLRQRTLSDIEMHIKKEPSGPDTMKEMMTLETDMSIKTEPSFFGMAFDDSMPQIHQEMSSSDAMFQRVLPSCIKVEPGTSVVEDHADCMDSPEPLLHGKYTSGASPYPSAGSICKQKLVVRLKNRLVSKYHPFSHRVKRLKAKRELEGDPACSSGAAMKCEPMSDSDTDFNQETVDAESFAGKFKQKRPRRRAAQTHGRPVCSHCQEHFCSRSSLKRHYKRKHTPEMVPFSCSYCDSKFARLIQLRAHERLHKGDKTFPCQQCDSAFTRACHLKVHMRKHTGERPYTCSVTDCKAAFRSTSNLNRHMMKHSGLRPYVCTVCNANFYQSCHLVSHVRKHTGERPFKCTQCEATFSQLTHLHRHRFRHTGKKPFECTLCGVGCMDRCALRKHMLTHNKCQHSGGESVTELKRKKLISSSDEVSVQQSS